MKSPTRVKFFLSALTGGSHMKMKLADSFKSSTMGRELTLQLLFGSLISSDASGRCQRSQVFFKGVCVGFRDSFCRTV